MPSLHFGWNVLVAAALVANLPGKWRYAALVMPAATGAAAVLSANHFFLDLAAGAVVALASLWLARWLRARLPRRPPFSVLT
jgi:membrane-associated phospholipid phosphatase